MYVITFYSFKGGVGRTMALVNVAAELARRDPDGPALKPLATILAKHRATMKSQYDAFADYVAAIANPNHSEYRELLKWYGPFDPAHFDAAKTTRRMKKGLPSW